MSKKLSLYNRILSAVLALVLLLGSVPVVAYSQEAAVAEDGSSVPTDSASVSVPIALEVFRDGEAVTSLGIYPHEKVEITAQSVEGGSYQWQILHPERENVWVNIYDETTATLPVSLALVEEVLVDNSTRIRCRVIDGEGNYLYTEPVTVSMLEPVQTIGEQTALYEYPIVPMADEPPEFVTVIVRFQRYDYQDGNLVLTDGNAFTPYIATLAYNSSLVDTPVECREIVGYEPELKTWYVGGVEQPLGDLKLIVNSEGNTVLNVDLNNITSNVEFVVAYEPIHVKYEVRYFFQNVYDDQYVEDSTLMPPKTATGYTGTTPDLHQDEVPGFTCLFFEPETIAADGSTVFYVYYERNYYLMEFDCNGGYGTDTLYVRYGTHVVVPAPVKSGFSFAGWDLIACTDIQGDEVTPDPAVTFGDGTKDELPEEVPPYNTSYKAIWTAVDTTYTIAYWLDYGDGTRSYIGGYLEQATSGTPVSGGDTLGRTGEGAVCGLLEHTHKDSCYVCRHTHDANCLPAIIRLGNTFESGDDYNAIQAAINAAGDEFKADGAYLFLIQADYDKGQNRHWPKLYYNSQLYSITVNGTDRIFTDDDNWKALIEGNAIVSGSATFTATMYNFKLGALDSCSAHSHTDACMACGTIAHEHTSACRQDAHYLRYLSADQNKIVEGDGSTVVNVYYTYKKYTLRYYYAKTTSDNKHYVVGGTTYPFGGGQYGNDASESTSVETLLNNVPVSEWGEVESVPQIKEKYLTGENARGYFTGTMVDTKTGTTYHYLEFTAIYGQSLETLWPVDIFEPVKIVDTHDQCPDLEYAYFSAWNGEYRVKYTRDCHKGANNRNLTIKGLYTKLDDNVIFSYEFDDVPYVDKNGNDTSLVSYLCFWENGANINWSVPELYIYNIWLPCLNNLKENAPAGKETRWEYQTWFYLHDSYNIYDDSFIKSQTAPAITGYSYKERQWQAHFISDTLLDDEGYYLVLNGGRDTKYSDGTVYSGDWTYQKTLESLDLGNDRYLLYDEELYDPVNPIDGISHELYREAYTVDFFYNRNTHKITFWNHSEYLMSGTGSIIPYATNLGKYGDYAEDLIHGLIPGEEAKYPSSLEPGAYEFEGWYKTEHFDPLTRVDWPNETMPDSDFVVYAKWVPINRNVYFFEDYDDMQAYLADPDAAESDQYFWDTTDGSGNPVSYPISVGHGNLLGSAYSYIPQRDDDLDNDGVKDYTFVGWFYIDENGKKRFAPDTMEVKRDLYLFAEWRTEIDAEYTVNYVLEEQTTIKGTSYPADTPIAEPYTGHLSVGHTKTFEAKSGSQLYEIFQGTNLFPSTTSTSSHSILMDPDSSKNVFTFKYVVDEEVNYKVRYLDKTTGLPLLADKTGKSTAAIVTEKFVNVDGYIPENYYIRKVLTADGDSNEVIPENVIVFYYVPTTTTALYTVEFYREKLDSTDANEPNNYEQVNTVVYSGEIGENMTYLVDPNEFTGFDYAFSTVTTYNEEGKATTSDKQIAETLSGELSESGLEFKVYYSRKEAGYKIQFLEWGTGNVLGYGSFENTGVSATPISKDYKVDSVKSYAAPDMVTKDEVDYFFYATAEKPQTQSLTFQADTEDNVLTFYYKARSIAVFYEGVCHDPGSQDCFFGAPNLNMEYVSTSAAQGTDVLVGLGYVFKGWYKDEACQEKVPDEWVTGTKIKPKTAGITSTSVTYYALFEPVKKDLTITKKAGDGTTIPETDSFLFRITGTNAINQEVSLLVTIHGEGSVTIQDLYCGDYTVTEITDWSWTYDVTQGEREQTVVLSESGDKVNGVAVTDAVVTFTNSDKKVPWLHGENFAENYFN